MDNPDLLLLAAEPTPRFGPRDVVAIGFRHRRLLVVSFLAILAATAVFALSHREYASEMQLLVKRERVDPVVTSQESAVVRYPPSVVTEEELNSEIQLLKGNDLLRKVVIATGLQHCNADTFWSRLRGCSEEEKRIATNVGALTKSINIDVPKRSNIIVVRYRSRDPKEAALVLQNLANLYLEKHTVVHRPPGQYDFFEQQTQRYRQELASAEARLAEFPEHEGGVVAGAMERDLMVQKIADLKGTLQTTVSTIVETKERITSLEAQLKSAPDRITTLVRQADNPPLMEKLQGTLLDLELQHTELLQKYQPTHRKVHEVEQKIAETHAAIEAALKTPMTEQTTDRDPAYEWMREELAKGRTDLQSMEARAAAIRNSIAEFQQRAQMLNKRSIEQQELLRAAKASEENYELYRRKREEARITDALDHSKILNVTLAEEPSTPVLPTQSLPFILMKAILAACVVSTATVLLREYLDPTFRTPLEVHRYLGIQVLAALPERLE